MEGIELKEILDEQIKENRIVLSNLKAEISRLKVKATYDNQLEELQKLKGENKEKKTYVKERDDVASRGLSIGIKEEALDRRIKEVEKREQMSLDLEQKRTDLLLERRNFLDYKREQQREIDEAQEVVQQAKYKEDEIKQKEDSLFDLEERVLARKDIADRRDYEVELKEKELKIKEANFEALQKGDKDVTQST